jgi:hypothetical protein
LEVERQKDRERFERDKKELETSRRPRDRSRSPEVITAFMMQEHMEWYGAYRKPFGPPGSTFYKCPLVWNSRQRIYTPAWEQAIEFPTGGEEDETLEYCRRAQR